MATVRRPATDVSAFNIDGSTFITALHDAGVKMDAKDEDVAGVADPWSYAFPTKYHAEIDANFFIETVSMVVALGDTVLLFYNMGGNTYSGNFLIASVHHTAPRDGMQMQKVTFKNQGQPTIA